MVKGTSRQRTSRLSFKLQERKEKNQEKLVNLEKRGKQKKRGKEKNTRKKKVRDNNQKQWRKVEDVLGIY